MRKAKKMMVILLALGIVASFVSGVSAGDRTDDGAVRSFKINVNKASLEELSGLKRIGAKYAERIIQYREKNGPFKSVEDMTNVPGIGPKTLEANKGILTVK